jgi:hypothetical protein
MDYGDQLNTSVQRLSLVEHYGSTDTHNKTMNIDANTYTIGLQIDRHIKIKIRNHY